MARMLDDGSRAKMLMQMLSQQGGSEDGPPSGYPQPTDSLEGVHNIGTQQLPPNGLQQNAPDSSEPMIPVPASLAHAGMQALMMQASGGRSQGADGQGSPYMQMTENDNAGMPNKLSPDDKDFMQYVTEGIYDKKNVSQMAKERTKEPTNINGKSMKWNK